MPIYLNFLSLKIQKMCDPTQVTIFKWQPHQSIELRKFDLIQWHISISLLSAAHLHKPIIRK